MALNKPPAALVTVPLVATTTALPPLIVPEFVSEPTVEPTSPLKPVRGPLIVPALSRSVSVWPP